MQPYYQDKGITIYHGDCRDVLPLLSGDLIVADPPYGVDKTTEYDDSTYPTWWVAPALQVAPRVLCMPGNTSLMIAGSAFGEHYRDTIALYAVNGMTRSAIAFGNWIPVIAAGDWKWEARPNLIKFTVSTWEQINHPSPKPLEAMRGLLTHYSKPGWIIIDPFMGSGSTLIAARNLGLCAIGIELDREYCDEAIRRLNTEFEAAIVAPDVALDDLPLFAA